MFYETSMNTTRVFIFGSMLVALSYDLFAVWFGGTDASVSQVITDAVGNHPFVSFMCGVLVCHFFGFTMRPTDKK